VPLQLADSELQFGGNPEYHKITKKLKAARPSRLARLILLC
jgi:hypothetical protein